MSNSFNTNLPLEINQDLRRMLIEDFKFLYTRYSQLLRLINEHKNTTGIAHETYQINENGRTQFDVNADLQKQISHLAVAPRNNSENEIVQARVDILGNGYDSLKEHLIAWESRTKIMKDEVESYVDKARQDILDIEYRFDPENQEFLYITDLSPRTNAVMQSFWFDERTGIIYMTQAYGDYRITRLRPNGAFLDQMNIVDGGHGTHNGYRYIDDTLWIYSFIRDANGGNRIVRFTYHPKVNLSYGTYDMEEVFTGHPERPYMTPIINQHTQEILFRIEYPKSEWNKRNSMNYIEIRDLKDVDNRVNKVKAKFDIPLELTTNDRPMQGIEFDENYVYWYTGTSNKQVDNMINVFDRKTGKEVYNFVADYGGVDGQYAGDVQEPEGLQIYYNREGKKLLMLGVVVGGDGNRTHKIYAAGQRGVIEELKSRGTPVPLTDTGGRTKPLPLDPNKIRNLSDITEPGYYYLYSNHTKNLDDFPEGIPRDAGWFFDVYPAQSNGDVRQVLNRNSYGRNILSFERFTSEGKNGNVVAPWNFVYKTAGYWERIPQGVKKIQDLKIVGMTYYITAAETSMLTDFPKDRKGVAGWIVHIEQGEDSGYVHRIVRNNSTSNMEVLYRNYHANGTITPWTIFKGEAIK